MNSTSSPSTTAPAVAGVGDESVCADHRDRWIAELENLERLLSIQERLLSDGDLIDVDVAQVLFQPPAGMDFLPVDLAEWATKLAERTDEIVRLARDLAADVPSPRRAIRSGVGNSP